MLWLLLCEKEHYDCEVSNGWIPVALGFYIMEISLPIEIQSLMTSHAIAFRIYTERNIFSNSSSIIFF